MFDVVRSIAWLDFFLYDFSRLTFVNLSFENIKDVNYEA